MNKRKELLLSIETDTKFKQIFKCSIKTFFCQKLARVGIVDFDIIAFDKWLKVPDNVSMKDFLTQKYSQEVAVFVQSLL